MKKNFSAVSPTRIDLAGGTLDMWPLYNFVGEAKTINIATSISTYADLEIREDTAIEIESEDLGLRKFYVDRSRFLEDTSPNLSLYRGLIDYFKPEFGFHLKTRSESPVGGGLGGSSSLWISLLKVFASACNHPLEKKSPTEWVQLAHNLESRQLLTPTGTQDYFPAITGGLSLIDYSAGGLVHRVLSVDSERFLSHAILVYTGRSHHSGLNNFEVLKAAVEKNPKTIKALVRLKSIAEQMAFVLQKPTQNAKASDLEWEIMVTDIARLFAEEYIARLDLFPAFTCPEIERLHEITKSVGAYGIKICGAGGGGCVMVWTPSALKQIVAELCGKEGFQVLPFTIPQAANIDRKPL